MIFAEMEYQAEYSDVHDELVGFLSRHFTQIDSGLQSDSWIWIADGGERVVIDTFTSMKHQIKSKKASKHVQNVIETLLLRYKLRVYEKPELEPHEGDYQAW